MAGGRILIDVDPDLTGFPGKLQAGLQGTAGVATAAGRGIGLALVAGTAAAAVGFKALIDIGTQYEATLNEIQGVSGATGDQMAAVAAKAKELGSDLELSGVSAADAAGAILELSKGGLTLEQSMTAAKGALALAGAAQIDGARAAEIQTQTLNQFNLSAEEAGRVADVLANTANLAAGGVEDIGLAMKYVGPVAASMGISLEDTATSVGILANNGILADTAGTSLRGMLVSLAAPSAAAKKGLDALGISAFDSQGKFVGLGEVYDQLQAAQGRMTDQQFQAAAAMAFGREPLAAINALAKGGAEAFDEFSTSLATAPGALEISRTKMQGLSGALEGFKSNLETVGISIYDLIKGPLEDLTRFGTDGLSALNDGLAALGGDGDLGGKIGRAFDTGEQVVKRFVGVLDNAREAAEPVIDGVLAIFEAATEGDGAVGILEIGLRSLASAAEFASGTLVPVGTVVGTLLQLFAALPGPVQATALALLALKASQPALAGLRNGLREAGSEGTKADKALGKFGQAVLGVTSPVRGAVGAVRQFRDEMRLQRALASASGEELGRLGSANAAFESSTLRSVTAVRGWRDDVRTMQAAAEGAGAPIGRLDASLQALSERSPAVAAMAASFVRTSTAAEEFGQRAGAAGREAAEGLGENLGNRIRATGDAVQALPGRIAGAASTLYTTLGVAAINTAEAIGRIPERAADAGRTLYTGLGVAAINTAEAVGRIPGRIADAANTITTGLGVAAINAGEKLTNLRDRAVDLGTSIPGRLTAPFRQFGDEMRVQTALADASGQSLGRLGAASAAFNTSTVPAVAAVRGLRDAVGTGLTTALDGARTALSNTADFVTQMPGRIVTAVRAIPEQAGGAIRTFGDTVQAGFGRLGGAVDTGIGHLTRFAGYAGGAFTASVSGLGRALGPQGLLGALGGPWGLALTGVTVGLGLLADGQARAEDSARRHQAAVDGLRDSLNEVTGAATAATREMTAQSLTSVKLSDGTTTLAAALQRAGISATDYVDATTGNQGKLEQLNGTLHAQASVLIENSGLYKTYKSELDGAGVSLDLITDAALGNVPAQQELSRALEDTSISGYGVTGWAKDAIGPLAEVGSLLGDQAGKYKEASEAARTAAQANQNFDDILKTLAENKAFDVIAKGGEVTGLAAESFNALGQSAQRTAQDLAKSAEQYGGVEAGAAKARESMEQSREAFVKAAEGALGSREAAERLADQLGLIPAAAETIFRLDAQGAQAELITLNEQLKAVPNQKDVTVRTLSAEAQQQLRDMGFAVEQLPDNKGVRVTVEDAEGRAKLAAFVTTIETTKAAPQLDLNTATAQQRADGMKAYVEGLVMIAKADADTAPGTAKGDAMKAHIDGITAIMKADADTTPGTASGDALQAHIQGLIGIMTADANNAPGTAKGDAMRAYIQGLIGIMTADADSAPGTAKGDALKRYLDGLRAALKLDADDGPARATVKNFLTEMNGKVFTVVQRTRVEGTLLGPNARGNIVSALPMADGASLFNGLPMGSAPSGIAAIYPPNTPRIIGDRIRDDEAYIPLNKSARSRAIFEETARRLGYSVARGMADGSVVAFADDLQRLIAAQRASFGGAPGGGARVDVSAPVLDVKLYVDGKAFDARIEQTVVQREQATVRRAKMGAGV